MAASPSLDVAPRILTALYFLSMAVPTPRPTEKARATRARLIDSAATAFVRDGYGATSVRDLAERSEVTSGALYGHFANKANLLGEAVRLRITRDLEERGGERYEETTLAEYLDHNFRDYPRRAALRALVVEAAAAARVDPDVRRLVHDVMVEKQSEWTRIYRDIWAREDLDPAIDPESVHMLLWAAELGMGVLEALDVELPKPRAFGRLVGRLVALLHR
jgi:AcrR family transcriptional regulator